MINVISFSLFFCPSKLSSNAICWMKKWKFDLKFHWIAIFLSLTNCIKLKHAIMWLHSSQLCPSGKSVFNLIKLSGPHTLESNWNCFCGAASLPNEDVLSMYNGNWTSAQKLNKNNYNMVFSHLTFPFAWLLIRFSHIANIRVMLHL